MKKMFLLAVAGLLLSGCARDPNGRIYLDGDIVNSTAFGVLVGTVAKVAGATDKQALALGAGATALAAWGSKNRPYPQGHYAYVAPAPLYGGYGRNQVYHPNRVVVGRHKDNLRVDIKRAKDDVYNAQAVYQAMVEEGYPQQELEKQAGYIDKLKKDRDALKSERRSLENQQIIWQGGRR